MDQPAILFVCLGNICRSPLAEAAFRKASGLHGLDALADSAGTAAYHVGKPPDPRSIRMAAQQGIDISAYRARQVSAEDFLTFTNVLALDHANLDDLRAIAPADARAELGLLLDHVPGRTGEAVADPYYGGEEGFQETWRDVWAAAEALAIRLSSRA